MTPNAPRRRPVVSFLVAVVAMVIAVSSGGTSQAQAPGAMANGTTVVPAAAGTPWFTYPDAIAAEGHDLWVAGWFGSVSELDAPSTTLVRTISGPSYQFSQPDAVVTAGPYVLVASTINGGHITELWATTGALVRVISGPSYRFDWPYCMVADGPDVFVSNIDGRTVTEVNALSGALVRVISAPAYQLQGPGAMAVSGHHLFVANNNRSVTELDTSTGALVRVIADSLNTSYKFGIIRAMAVYGPVLFVLSASPRNPLHGGWLGEVDLLTGKPARVVQGDAYALNDPTSMAVSRGHLFIVSYFAPPGLTVSGGRSPKSTPLPVHW